ncbi:MAG: TIGR04551 family protein [Archangium sp.]|nr:TIGR04551 family protein [Archangium sp.]MDP3570032.1 TIGR04551 family protein [Archangium sp.]
MQRVLLAALALSSTLVLAQADAGTLVPASNGDSDLRKEFEAKLDAARREVKELREEMRAQLATQSVAQGWQEDWVDEKRKLELVTFDGYLRVRPDLFYKFDMNRGDDGAGFPLFPRSSASERTQAGVNMRFRFEPTINVSEEVRVRAQVDALDNLIWGSTPDYAFSRNRDNGFYSDRNEFSIFSASQTTQRSGINSVQDSIAVKRVWGEVSTPVGILRFGRMGSHWGLGMLHNDGNGIDNDWGDTVDRVSFTAEPLPGFYVTPMMDFNIEGLSSRRSLEGGQPFDLSNSDDAHSYIIAAQRRDTEQERRAKLDANGTVFNYGLHFTYRTQRNDNVDALSAPLGNSEGTSGSTAAYPAVVLRKADIFMPDLWAKVERKEWRIEAEFAAVLGGIQNRSLNANSTDTNQALGVYQFGGVIQGEVKLLNGDLEIGGEVGFASGDKAAGFGNAPRRKGSGLNGATELGDTEGPQYRCDNGCADNEINNFRFNRDYRVDMILYREILGGVTDSLYFKPRAKYRITQGFEAFASVIYSRALFPESAPGFPYANSNASLGVEINGGARYETEDGFYGQLQYGILFPLEGFKKGGPLADGSASNVPLANIENPQALRAVVGIKF